MSDVTLGQILEESEERDAIHVAIVPVIAAVKLAPGQDIGFVDDSRERVGMADDPIGIVDPFLKSMVFPEQRCWMMLYPNTVTGMRHHWSHPAFEEQPKVPFAEDSEVWLREFAKTADCPGYEVLVAAASGGSIEKIDGYEEYGYKTAYRLGTDELFFVGRDAHGEIPPEFWDHVENVTGKVCQMRPSQFSCSC